MGVLSAIGPAIKAGATIIITMLNLWLEKKKDHKEADEEIRNELAEAFKEKGKKKLSRINAAFVRAKRLHS